MNATTEFRCHACGAVVRRYRRALYRRPLYVLNVLLSLGPGWHHRTAIAAATKDPEFNVGDSDFSKLRFWWLIEENPDVNGEWRYTNLAVQFRRGAMTLPRQVYVEQNKCYGFVDVNDRVSWEEAWKKHRGYRGARRQHEMEKDHESAL